MRPNRCFTDMLHQPTPRCLCVRHGFDGGEGLRRNDQQGSRRIKLFQRIGNMRSVDIGDEMQPRPVMIGC